MITIQSGAEWRAYTNTIPSTADVLGTVTSKKGRTGALVRFRATGLYAQVNGGIIQLLAPTEVMAALAGESAKS